MGGVLPIFRSVEMGCQICGAASRRSRGPSLSLAACLAGRVSGSTCQSGACSRWRVCIQWMRADPNTTRRMTTKGSIVEDNDAFRDHLISLIRGAPGFVCAVAHLDSEA